MKLIPIEEDSDTVKNFFTSQNNTSISEPLLLVKRRTLGNVIMSSKHLIPIKISHVEKSPINIVNNAESTVDQAEASIKHEKVNIKPKLISSEDHLRIKKVKRLHVKTVVTSPHKKSRKKAKVNR
jgi:formiminotetrahydrofolate cyclodeaminase